VRALPDTRAASLQQARGWGDGRVRAGRGQQEPRALSLPLGKALPTSLCFSGAGVTLWQGAEVSPAPQKL